MAEKRARHLLTALAPMYVVLGLTLCALLLALGGYFSLLKPTQLQVNHAYQRVQQLQLQIHLADTEIHQLRHLRQVIQQDRLQPPSQAFADRISTTALAQPVFIRELLQVDTHHWQVHCLGTYQQLQAFTKYLSQQASDWRIDTLQWQQSANDEPITLKILMTNASTTQHGQCCHVSKTPYLARNPFSVSVDARAPLTRYPLAQIEWLGLLRDAVHSGALIRLPNQDIRLVQVGDTLGTEQWHLSQLHEQYAEFIDSNHHPHQLRLILHANAPSELSHD